MESTDSPRHDLALPEVITKPAALVSDDYAVLRGSIAPKLWNYDPVFEYGTSPAPISTPTDSLPVNVDGYEPALPPDGTKNISASASGLVPNTTYYYRLTARTCFGEESQDYYGPMETFTTSGSGAPTFDHAIQGLKNNPVAVTDGGVFASIPNSDGLTLSIAGTDTTSVRGGIITRNGNSVTYMPAADYVGLDTFGMQHGPENVDHPPNR